MCAKSYIDFKHETKLKHQLDAGLRIVLPPDMVLDFQYKAGQHAEGARCARRVVRVLRYLRLARTRMPIRRSQSFTDLQQRFISEAASSCCGC